MEKKLYLLSQNVTCGGDTYDSLVVCSDSEENARKIEPPNISFQNDDWTDIKNVKVKYIGEASENIKIGEIICTSYNAG